MHEPQTPLSDLKGTVKVYFFVSMAIIVLITLTIFLVSCSSFHNHSEEFDKMIQFEKDGHLYPVKRL